MKKVIDIESALDYMARKFTGIELLMNVVSFAKTDVISCNLNFHEHGKFICELKNKNVKMTNKILIG